MHTKLVQLIAKRFFWARCLRYTAGGFGCRAGTVASLVRPKPFRAANLNFFIGMFDLQSAAKIKFYRHNTVMMLCCSVRSGVCRGVSLSARR